MGKNLSASVGDMSSTSGSEKIGGATEQLSPCTTTTEAHAPRACALQQEKPSKVEKAYAKQQRPSTAEKYNFKIKILLI